MAFRFIMTATAAVRAGSNSASATPASFSSADRQIPHLSFMKYFLLKIVPALLLMSMLAGSARAQGRLATIDLRKVFENYYKKKQAQAAIDDRKVEMEKDIKAMLGEYDKTNSAYQVLLADAKNPALSAEEREKRQKSAEDSLRQLRELED